MEPNAQIAPNLAELRPRFGYIATLAFERKIPNIERLKRVFRSPEDYLRHLIEAYNLTAFTYIYYCDPSTKKLHVRSMIAKLRSHRKKGGHNLWWGGLKEINDMSYYPLFGFSSWPKFRIEKISSGGATCKGEIKYTWPPSWHHLRKIEERLLGKDWANIERMEAQKLKPYLIARQGKRCWYCKIELPEEKLTIDHIEPIAKGGRTSLDNCVLACRSCNSRKGVKGDGQNFRKLSETLCSYCKKKAFYRIVTLDGRYVYRCKKHLFSKQYLRKYAKRVIKINDVIVRDSMLIDKEKRGTIRICSTS